MKVMISVVTGNPYIPEEGLEQMLSGRGNSYLVRGTMCYRKIVKGGIHARTDLMKVEILSPSLPRGSRLKELTVASRQSCLEIKDKEDPVLHRRRW